jgi:hypothetical protein
MTPSPFTSLRLWIQGHRTALAGGGVLLFSLSLMGLPMSSLQLAQMQALNRELGKLCNDPPRQALNVCRLHARLIHGL